MKVRIRTLKVRDRYRKLFKLPFASSFRVPGSQEFLDISDYATRVFKKIVDDYITLSEKFGSSASSTSGQSPKESAEFSEGVSRSFTKKLGDSLRVVETIGQRRSGEGLRGQYPKDTPTFSEAFRFRVYRVFVDSFKATERLLLSIRKVPKDTVEIIDDINLRADKTLIDNAVITDSVSRSAVKSHYDEAPVFSDSFTISVDKGVVDEYGVSATVQNVIIKPLSDMLEVTAVMSGEVILSSEELKRSRTDSLRHSEKVGKRLTKKLSDVFELYEDFTVSGSSKIIEYFENTINYSEDFAMFSVVTETYFEPGYVSPGYSIEHVYRTEHVRV